LSIEALLLASKFFLESRSAPVQLAVAMWLLTVEAGRASRGISFPTQGRDDTFPLQQYKPQVSIAAEIPRPS
jgi:hypothetical protein